MQGVAVHNFALRVHLLQELPDAVQARGEEPRVVGRDLFGFPQLGLGRDLESQIGKVLG